MKGARRDTYLVGSSPRPAGGVGWGAAVLGGAASAGAQVGSEHEQESEQVLPGDISLVGSGGGCAPLPFGEPASDPLWIELEEAALAEVAAELPADNPYVCAAP